MRKNCIVLDFDHTVFNTTLYVQSLKKTLEKEGVSPHEFDEKRAYLKKCCTIVDIDRFADALSHPNKRLIHDTIHDVIVGTASRWIFSDVQPFIDYYINYFDILLVTQGDRELQTEKIQHSKLQGIKESFIVDGAKDEIFKNLVERYDDIHFIDDKAENIDHIKKTYPAVYTYFITRPEDMPYGNAAPGKDCADNILLDLKIGSIIYKKQV